jgi:hypothetical protein
MAKSYFVSNPNLNGVIPMKKTSVVLVLAASLASMVQAQINTNEIAGDLAAVYLNQPVVLSAGSPALVGASLARPAILKGELNAAVADGATTLVAVGTDTFTGLSLAGGPEDAPDSDNHYIIEFTSGPFTGLIKQVTAFSGSTATVAGGLPQIDANTRFVLRKDHTLGSLFGTSDASLIVTRSGLTSGSTAGSADVVSVLNSAGQWVKYFYRSGTGWKLTTARTGSDRQHVRVSLGTGVLVSPTASKTIGLSGEYRGTRARVTLVNAATIVANPYPVSTSLAQTDLASSLAKSTTAGNSDELRFLENGRLVNYFARSGTGTFSPGGIEYAGFRPSLNRNGSNVDDSISIPAGGAVLVKRAGLAHDLTFRPQYLAQ